MAAVAEAQRAGPERLRVLFLGDNGHHRPSERAKELLPALNAWRRNHQERTTLNAWRYRVDWKPMPTVGAGVFELRIHTTVEHRVFYVAKFAEAIYVLHAFEKRSQQTRKADLELGRHRYHEVLHARGAGPAATRKRRK